MLHRWFIGLLTKIVSTPSSGPVLSNRPCEASPRPGVRMEHQTDNRVLFSDIWSLFVQYGLLLAGAPLLPFANAGSSPAVLESLGSVIHQDPRWMMWLAEPATASNQWFNSHVTERSIIADPSQGRSSQQRTIGAIILDDIWAQEASRFQRASHRAFSPARGEPISLQDARPREDCCRSDTRSFQPRLPTPCSF